MSESPLVVAPELRAARHAAPFAHIAIRAISHADGPGIAATWFDDASGSIQLVILAHRVDGPAWFIPHGLAAEPLRIALGDVIHAALRTSLVVVDLPMPNDRLEFGLRALAIPFVQDPLDGEATNVVWTMTVIDHLWVSPDLTFQRLAALGDRLFGRIPVAAGVQPVIASGEVERPSNSATMQPVFARIEQEPETSLAPASMS